VPRRVLVVFGTRPEAIKMAPIVERLRERPDVFETIVAVTAQHREMLDQVLDLFGITTEHDLGIMRHGQSLTSLTIRALEGLSMLVEEVRPDVVLVQGDTTTTLAAALAAFYHKVPVGHVEAGLRTDDVYQPFPEEIDRRLTSQIASLHFAPTSAAASRLLDEGVPIGRVFLTGNTVIDALLEVQDKPYEFLAGPVADALASGRRIVLVTAHRRENWGEPIAELCGALRDLVRAHPDIHVLFATHANPIVREVVDRELVGMERVGLLGPLEYLPFVKLMGAATIILSDSGGVQEEAPSLGKPVLVLRNVTERPEAIEAGTAKLVGMSRNAIVVQAGRLLDDPAEYKKMARAVNPFGDGLAATRIADILEAWRG
jgi:UDP-N-acetylglucosamine 2-epimerase (non-hydrolysing)